MAGSYPLAANRKPRQPLPGRIRPPHWPLADRGLGSAPSQDLPLRPLLLVPAFAICAAVQVQAAEPSLQVSAVQIIGAKHVHADRIRFILDARPGKTYSGSQLQQAVADDVRAIEKMGPFTAVKAELA